MEKINKFTSKIYRIYYYLFKDRFSKKLNLKFDNIKRWDLIDYLNTTYKFNSYLEIGCDDDQLFSKISIQEKIGVDPVSGGNYRAKSDDFFDKNLKKFDLVFIDGLHEYHQVKKDILNSIKFLNKEGFILVHDCLPRTKAHQSIPRYRGSWNGDVWKAIVELRTKENLNIFTSQIDLGVGVIKKEMNSNILKTNIKNFKDLKFKDYYYNYKNFMNIKSYEDTLKSV